MINEVNFIEQIKNTTGQHECTLNRLKEIYASLERPKANAVKIRKNFFVSFESASRVQFKILDEVNIDKLSFIENLNLVDATINEEKFIDFLLNEIWQGKKLRDKLFRLFQTLLPLILLNFLVLKYASEKAIANTFSGLLTAVSIFIAIFSLFTVGQEHLERKKLLLFKKGKLAYLFSVDKNITELGISTIFICLFAILIVKDSTNIFWTSWCSKRNWLVWAFINISFFGTWVILRSLIEFYIKRPAQFILGDMKKEFLENFEQK